MLAIGTIATFTKEIDWLVQGDMRRSYLCRFFKRVKNAQEPSPTTR